MTARASHWELVVCSTSSSIGRKTFFQCEKLDSGDFTFDWSCLNTIISAMTFLFIWDESDGILLPPSSLFLHFYLKQNEKNSNIQNISLSFQCTLAQFSLYIFWKRTRAPFAHTANALYKMAFVFLIHTQIPVLIEIQTLIGQLKSHGKVCKISIYRKMKSEIQSLRSQHIEHGAIHNRQFFFCACSFAYLLSFRFHSWNVRADCVLFFSFVFFPFN